MNTKVFAKIIILFFLTILWNRSIAQVEIKVQSVEPMIACAGGTIKVRFDAKNFIDPANTFTVFISDKDGDFSKPFVIGTGESVNFYNYDLPPNLSEGSNYKIKVVSSKPVVSQEFSKPIAIQAKLAFNLSVENVPHAPWNKKAFYFTNADSVQYKLNGTDTTTLWNFYDGIPHSYKGSTPPKIKYNLAGEKKFFVSRKDRACMNHDTTASHGYNIEVFSCAPTLPPRAALIADSNKRLIENPLSNDHFVLCRDAPLYTVTKMAKVNLYLEEGSNFYIKGSTYKTIIYNTENASAKIVAASTSRYKESVIIKSKISSLTFSPATLKDSFAVLTCPRVAVDYYTNYRCLVGNLCDTFDEYWLSIIGKDTVCVGESAEYKIVLGGEKMRWQTSEAGKITSQTEQKVTVQWQKPGLTTVNLYVQLRFCDYEFITKKNVYVRSISEGGCITGVSSSLKNLNITVSPNPVEDILTINTNSEIQHVEVMNLLGKTVYNTQESFDNINMTKLDKGLYMVLIYMKSGEKSIFKVEKNN